jgi:protein-S-isoprenylcysteine O-methyltransferase Ste14
MQLPQISSNRLAGIINTVSILVLLVYWIISARLVKKTQEKVPGIGVYIRSGLIVVAVVLFNIKIYPISIKLFSFSTYTGIFSILFSMAGLVIAIAARRALAGNWNFTVTFKKEHELITRGLYKYVRHPIYSGILVILIGSVLAIGTLGALAGFIIIFIAFGLKLNQEEELMTKYFREEYLAYKKKTKALIPFIW